MGNPAFVDDLPWFIPRLAIHFRVIYQRVPWCTMIYILNFGIFHISNWKLYQRVQPLAGCDFRHTDFVELTAPLLKSAVLLGFASSPFSWIQERPNTLQVKEHPGRLQALYSWQVWLGAWHDAGPSAVEPNAEPDAVRRRSTFDFLREVVQIPLRKAAHFRFCLCIGWFELFQWQFASAEGFHGQQFCDERAHPSVHLLGLASKDVR